MINRDIANEWFLDEESCHRVIMHRTREQVVSVRTAHQHVKVVDTYNLGRVLILDNKIQSAETDEYIYHECLVHPAMMRHGSPTTVLVLGGGEGATLREVLKYRQVAQVTMVDIDEELVRLCDHYLEAWHRGAFKDPRVTLVFDDAAEFVTRHKDTYDVIIMDINDPVSGGPAAALYTKELFDVLKGLMHRGSVLATQAVEVFFDESDRHSVLHRTLSMSFGSVESYCEYVPSFGCMWGFLLCSDGPRASSMSEENIERAIGRLVSGALRFYDGEAHRRIFSLPKMVREMLARQTTISTAAAPMHVYG